MNEINVHQKQKVVPWIEKRQKQQCCVLEAKRPPTRTLTTPIKRKFLSSEIWCQIHKMLATGQLTLRSFENLLLFFSKKHYIVNTQCEIQRKFFHFLLKTIYLVRRVSGCAKTRASICFWVNVWLLSGGHSLD